MSDLSEKYFKASIITMLQQSIIKSLETKTRKSLKKKTKWITELENTVTEIKN